MLSALEIAKVCAEGNVLSETLGTGIRARAMETQILRQRSAIILIALFVWFIALAPTAYAADSNETVRLMVKVDPSVVTAAGGVIPTAVSADDLGLGWTVIEVPAGQEAAALAQLQNDPGVLDATPDYPLELTFSPDDPALTNDRLWNLNQIGADLAWEFSRGADVVVAVVDSGVDPNHPDLRDRLVPGYNFQDDNTDTSDQCGHGTHVAGIVAAAGNNALGGLGVAFSAKIMPVKVMAAGLRRDVQPPDEGHPLRRGQWCGRYRHHLGRRV